MGQHFKISKMNWYVWFIILVIILFLTNKKDKGDKMDLLTLLQNLIQSVAALQSQLADAETALAQAKQESYDAGFAAGVASVPTGDPENQFSQADLDAAVSAAVGPLNDQIAAMQAQIDTIPQQISDAINQLKASLKQSYQDQQVAETDSETGFSRLLD